MVRERWVEVVRAWCASVCSRTTTAALARTGAAADGGAGMGGDDERRNASGRVTLSDGASKGGDTKGPGRARGGMITEKRAWGMRTIPGNKQASARRSVARWWRR